MSFEPLSYRVAKSEEYLKGFADGREAQKRDALAAVEAVLARSHNAGWQHACEEILRRVTESGSSEERKDPLAPHPIYGDDY